MKKELMKLAMPSKKAPEMEAGMDLEGLSLDDESDMEEGMAEEDMAMDMEDSGDGKASPLADIADEELLAEVKARGLSLEDESSEADAEEDMAEMDMEDEEDMPA